MKESVGTPPRLFLRFFRWYCHPSMQDYIEGDLMEVYHLRRKQFGKRKANVKFMIDVILLFRPGIIKPPEGFKNLNTYGMYKSYFKIGWRSLLKNKGYSVINISGLAVGMIVVMLIGLWVYDELSFDKFHKHYDRVAQVVSNVSLDGETFTYSTVPMPTAYELRTNYKSEFEAVAATQAGDRIVSYKEKVFTRRGCFSDYAFPEIAALDMKLGSLKSFRDRSHLLLSASFATAMFGSTDPLNKEVRIGNADLTVVGVYNDLPNNSSFHGMNFIASVDLLFSDQAAMNNWRSSSFQLYVLLNKTASIESISAKIENVIFDHTQDATKPKLILNPMARWHLYEFRNGKNVPARLELVLVVGIIGVFILALACINFVNLSTARSEKRAKEIGVRKSLGSQKIQLVSQFLCESFLISLFALAVAMVALVPLLPWFNNFSNKEIEIPFDKAMFWFIALGSIAIIGFSAGGYPAFYLSALKPVKALKGAVSSGRASSTPRRILVIVQFSISVMLIIGTLVTYNQVQFVKDRPTGYAREGLISIPLMTREIIDQYDALRLGLLKTKAVDQVSRSSSSSTDITSSADNLSWEGKSPDRQLLFGTILIDPYYHEVLSWKMKSGRNFSSEIASDTSGFIFNVSAIRQMGLSDPIGKMVTWHGKSWNILGVVEDMVMTSPFSVAVPTVFLMDNRERSFNYINIRLAANQGTATAIDELEGVFKKIVPGTPFEYRFADEEYARKFAGEESVGKLALTFTIVAILISCLGLLGLASFVAEQRTKEIGIRKVLGASIVQVWQLISSEFVVLVLIACALAIPVSWYLMSNWLLKYEYRMELGWFVFAAAACCAIVITLLTVSYHALSAAMMNPVKSLRSE